MNEERDSHPSMISMHLCLEKDDSSIIQEDNRIPMHNGTDNIPSFGLQHTRAPRHYRTEQVSYTGFDAFRPRERVS